VKLLESMGWTLLIAVGVAVIQSVLRLVSRWKRLRQQAGSRMLETEDFVFWHEWVVTALVVMVIFVVNKSLQDKISTATIVVGFVLLAIGLLPVPLGIGGLLCDADGNIADTKSALIANSIGLIFLLTVVAAGAHIYG
jgi:hypothetical protein